MKICLLGAPGCGKGTQAKMIEDHYGLTHISTGDLFREAIANNTPMGQEVKKYMSKLVPDEIVVKLLLERLSQDDCKNGYVLDGFPRTINQAEEFGKVADLDAVVYFNIDLQDTLNRINNRRTCKDCGEIYTIDTVVDNKCSKCGGEVIVRAEDLKAQERIDTYAKLTHPLVDYYKNKNLLKEIDSNKYKNLDYENGRRAVFNEVKEILEGLK